MQTRLESFTSIRSFRFQPREPLNCILYAGGGDALICGWLQGIKEALNESAHVVRSGDQNPAISADEKRQLIDTIYGAMIQMAHAGDDAFAQIDKALGK